MRHLYRTGMIPVMALALVGCKGKPAAAPPPEVAVITLQAERATLTSDLPGRVSAFLVAEVHPQVNGIIQQRAFTEGGDVKAGDLLYQLDPSPYKAALDTALAALARSEANLPSIRKRAERYKELLAVNAVGQQDNDDALAALKAAEADHQACKAGVEAARINLAYTRITAPISGRTGKSSVTQGALAAAYQGAAFTTIQQLDTVYVDSPQASSALLEIQRNLAASRVKGAAPGQAKVRLKLEDGTPYDRTGTLKFSDATVDPTTGSQLVRMVFPNPGHVLLPGMYVRVTVEEGVMENAILAPQQGVTRDAKGQAVAMVVDPAGKVEQRIVDVNRAVEGRWLIRAGLRPGDRLIMEGLQKIRPGIQVKVVPFVPKPAAK